MDGKWKGDSKVCGKDIQDQIGGQGQEDWGKSLCHKNLVPKTVS
jgi:hypothetical protein